VNEKGDKMRTTTLQMISISLLLLLAGSPVAAGEKIRIEKKGENSRSSVDLQVEAPSYSPAPEGSLYGGPYPPPPYWYYPYPYYPWPPPQGHYPTHPQEEHQSQLIPAGRLILLVDPVSAEVSVDGLQLTQRSDLSYEVGLLIGKHKVLVQAEGYEPHVEAVNIPGGQHILRTIRLNPVKPGENHESSD
jgi:hypothetical protein